MGNHVRAEQPDGNGFNGGVRLSWRMITALLGICITITGAFTTIYGIQAKAIAQIDSKLDVHCAKTYDAIHSLELSISKHVADPFAHERNRPTGE